MKTLRTIMIGLVALLLWSSQASAQRLIDTNTLSANLSATATTLTVTTDPGCAVNEFFFVDREVMRITAISSTTFTVQRAQAGTGAAAHDNAERFFCSPGGDFYTVDPDYGQDCTRGSGQAAVLPWINVRTGNIWQCLVNQNLWNGTNTMPLTYNSIQTGSP